MAAAAAGAVDQNIRLILEVKKRPCLYNYTLTDYSKKHIVDKAWADIGRELGCPGSECKEKWKNLRSVFVRQFKPTRIDGRLYLKKKPYYLTEHMKFTLPFIKSSSYYSQLNINPDTHEIQDNDNNNTDEEKDTVTYHFDENSRTLHIPEGAGTSLSDELTEDFEMKCNQVIENAISAQNNDEDSKETKSDQEERQGTKRSHSLPEEILRYLKNKRKRTEESSNKMFLLSLLDDMNAMDDRQRRIFKRKVLEITEEILDPKPEEEVVNIS